MNKTHILIRRFPQVLCALLAVASVQCSSDADPPAPAGTGSFPAATGGGVGTGGAGPGAGGVPGGGGVPGTGNVGNATGGAPLGGAGGVATGGFGGVTGGAGGVSTGGVGTGGIAGPVDPVGNDNRAPGFINLAPTPGAPLPAQGTALTPAAPTGWQWHPIEGSVCRDGSPSGIFVHTGTAKQLVIYLEGGGACSNVPFCRFNPKSVNEKLDGDGSTVLGTAAGAVPGRQQPGAYTGANAGVPAGTPAGIFDFANSANPFKDSSVVYVPYCTGDVHFGTRADATVPGTMGTDTRDIPKHQFMGYRNMEKIIARVQPTFADVTKVVVTGSSAGSFGAALNFSMIQDAFGNVPATVVGDSGVPFEDQYMFTCMQKRWREVWGLALPPDCTECQKPDGGGLLGLADFLLRKHPKAKIGLITTMQDEVMRLFFSVGLKDCSTYETADPVAITLGQLDPNVYMAGDRYTAALTALRAKYQPTNKFASFFMPGMVHQHLFRPSFYTTTAGGQTMADFVTKFVNEGTIAVVGP